MVPLGAELGGGPEPGTPAVPGGTIGDGDETEDKNADDDAEGEEEAAEAYGTVHMRLAAITVVELAQDITGALVTAHGVPRVFDALRL